jgi:hypothetical protein
LLVWMADLFQMGRHSDCFSLILGTGLRIKVSSYDA